MAHCVKEETYEEEKDSPLMAFARRELKPLLESDNKSNQQMADNILELLVVFVHQGHSGFSGAYCLDAFTKLADFEPLNIKN